MQHTVAKDCQKSSRKLPKVLPKKKYISHDLRRDRYFLISSQFFIPIRGVCVLLTYNLQSLDEPTISGQS